MLFINLELSQFHFSSWLGILFSSQGSTGRDDEGAVNRYSSQYEQRLDPFSAFGQRVSCGGGEERGADGAPKER